MSNMSRPTRPVPMHVGHCRGAVFGDALANLLAVAGHDVTREYYVNDAGAQVDALARSAYLRYREALGRRHRRDSGRPLSRRLSEAGRRLARRAARQASCLPCPRANGCRSRATRRCSAMLAMIEDDLAELGIHHDVFFSERSLIDGPRDEVAETIADLKSNGLVYTGRLPPPKGKVDEEWEDREQLLFRSDRVRRRHGPALWSSLMAATPISPPTWPITATSSGAVSTP